MHSDWLTILLSPLTDFQLPGQVFSRFSVIVGRFQEEENR